MTFPEIAPDVIDDAILNLAGENASRAAIFTAGQQVKFVIEALQNAVRESANCDVCGHFHPITEHPANAHSAEPTPAPVRHDHAMCDPARNCGPSIEGIPSDPFKVKTVSYPVPEGVYVAPPMPPFPQSLMDHVDNAIGRASEAARNAAAKAFVKPAPERKEHTAAQEHLGMMRVDAEISYERLRADAVTRRTLGLDWTHTVTDEDRAAAERLEAAQSLNDRPLFPGGRMRAEAQQDTPQPPDEEGMNPAYATRTDPEDKLRIIADVVNAQAPLGTDLANFRRRLHAILDMN
jgi:hypothetical protein